MSKKALIVVDMLNDFIDKKVCSTVGSRYMGQ
jgi:nicotinamidase-related amidase